MMANAKRKCRKTENEGESITSRKEDQGENVVLTILPSKRKRKGSSTPEKSEK